MDNKEIISELEDVTDILYDLNAKISFKYIALKHTVTNQDITDINEKIGKQIKTLRILLNKITR